MLPVPVGTVVYDAETGELSRTSPRRHRTGDRAGGRGGLGNAALASDARKAPGSSARHRARRTVSLELKVVADVG